VTPSTDLTVGTVVGDLFFLVVVDRARGDAILQDRVEVGLDVVGVEVVLVVVVVLAAGFAAGRRRRLRRPRPPRPTTASTTSSGSERSRRQLVLEVLLESSSSSAPSTSSAASPVDVFVQQVYRPRIRYVRPAGCGLLRPIIDTRRAPNAIRGSRTTETGLGVPWSTRVRRRGSALLGPTLGVETLEVASSLWSTKVIICRDAR
jgi:hypothetical protein